MRQATSELDRLSVRLTDLEQKNQVLTGALADAGAKVSALQDRVEELEALAHPLNARLVAAPA